MSDDDASNIVEVVHFDMFLELKTIVVDLQAQVIKLVANQVDLEAEIRQLTAKQNTATNKNTISSASHNDDKYKDASNRNNNETRVTISARRRSPKRHGPTFIETYCYIEDENSNSENESSEDFIEAYIESKNSNPENESNEKNKITVANPNSLRNSKATVNTTTSYDTNSEIWENSNPSLSIDELNAENKITVADPNPYRNKEANINTIVNDTTSNDTNWPHNNNMIEYVFKGSTHRYMFMDTIACSDGTSYKVGWNDRFIGIIVIMFQFFGYFYIVFLILREHKKGMEARASPTLEINSKYCYDTDAYSDSDFYWAAADGYQYSNLAQASVTTANLPDLIYCSNPTEIYNDSEEFKLAAVQFFVTCVMLLPYLTPDVYGAFILFKRKCWRSRLVGVLILVQALFAGFVAGVSTLNVFNTGFLDVFFLIIGVIFIHDIDEQVWKIHDTINQMRDKYHRLSLQFGIFFFANLSICLAFIIYIMFGENKKLVASLIDALFA